MSLLINNSSLILLKLNSPSVFFLHSTSDCVSSNRNFKHIQTAKLCLLCVSILLFTCIFMPNLYTNLLGQTLTSSVIKTYSVPVWIQFPKPSTFPFLRSIVHLLLNIIILVGLRCSFHISFKK